MKTQKSPSAIRDELQSLVLKELLGPANGADEEISEPNISVGDRYILGNTHPMGWHLLKMIMMLLLFLMDRLSHKKMVKLMLILEVRLVCILLLLV